MNKKIIINIIWLLHLLIVLLFFGLFLIPKLLWNNVIKFHFWYLIIIIFIQIIWGLIIYNKTKKIDIICPLTTLMQKLRGYEIKDKKNYNHSYIAELLNKLKIKVNYNIVSLLIFISIIIVFIQYILQNK